MPKKAYSHDTHNTHIAFAVDGKCRWRSRELRRITRMNEWMVTLEKKNQIPVSFLYFFRTFLIHWKGVENGINLDLCPSKALSALNPLFISFFAISKAHIHSLMGNASFLSLFPSQTAFRAAIRRSDDRVRGKVRENSHFRFQIHDCRV